MLQIDPQVAKRTYRWDTPEVAAFKYLFNFVLTAEVRDQVVHSLFTDYIASEASFAPSWYVSWDEARAMQDAGMVLGGHSHQHQPLATLSAADPRVGCTHLPTACAGQPPPTGRLAFQLSIWQNRYIQRSDYYPPTHLGCHLCLLHRGRQQCPWERPLCYPPY